ncbi:unnamed protein product, partial [Ectocarpus sp. 12 AP-2014]
MKSPKNNNLHSQLRCVRCLPAIIVACSHDRCCCCPHRTYPTRSIDALGDASVKPSLLCSCFPVPAVYYQHRLYLVFTPPGITINFVRRGENYRLSLTFSPQTAPFLVLCRISPTPAFSAGYHQDMDSTNALDSRSLLRINAHEESFLPVEMKVGWLSRQASMRSRASAMVGSRISQLDDAIRVRALLSILQSSSATTTPAARPETPPSGAGASSVAKIAQDSCSASEGEEGGRSRPKGKRHVRTDSGPPPDLQDLEVFARMAVAKIKVVLFQLASPAEVREREQQGKDVFDVYEGLLTSEALAKAAKEGFPTLDVETLMLPAHFRYRSLVAARHRYLLRKLGVLLDMEDGVDSLLEKAADTEKMDPSSLADVDLS